MADGVTGSSRELGVLGHPQMNPNRPSLWPSQDVSETGRDPLRVSEDRPAFVHFGHLLEPQ